MYILAGLLLLGLVANALVKPLREQTPNPKSQTPTPNVAPDLGIRDLGFGNWDLLRTALAWAAVGVPIAWGAWVTFTQALVLFSGGA
jgi:hypothetical protein